MTTKNAEITFEDVLKELLYRDSTGVHGTQVRDWFERARETGLTEEDTVRSLSSLVELYSPELEKIRKESFTEEDTARSLAELCFEDELANLGE